MVMIRPKGKAAKIAQQVLKGKGVKIQSGTKMDKAPKNTPYLQHQRDMDKQINKVKRSLDKGEKDVKKLLKMDKKFDKKLARCDKKMKKPMARGR